MLTGALRTGRRRRFDANRDKLGKRFMWGHIEEDDYRAEWDRLTARRAELVATQNTAAESSAVLPLDSLMDAWNTGNPRTPQRPAGYLLR